MTKSKDMESSQQVQQAAKACTDLNVFDVSVRGGGPDLLHHGCHKVVGLKVLGAELLATLRAAHGTRRAPPVLGDARFAKVVHAGQHDRLPEQVTANSTSQVFCQAAFGRGGGASGSRSSSSHGEGQFRFQSLSTRRKLKLNPTGKDQEESDLYKQLTINTPSCSC